MTSKWTKQEEENLIRNFTESDWEDFLEMLPDKTEDQIFKKSKKLGLTRKSEFVEAYYDENQCAWVDTYRIRGIGKVMHIFPAPKGTTLKETQNKYIEKSIRSLLKNKYITG